MDNVATEVNVGSHKFQLTVRDLMYVAGLIITGATIWASSTHRLDTLEKDRTDLYGKNETVSTRMDRMDQNGTRRSHETDAMQQQQIDYLTAQITEVNHVLRELTPKVDKIDTNVLWLMARQVEHK